MGLFIFSLYKDAWCKSSLRSASRAKTSFAIEIIEKNLFGGKYQNSSGVK
jgi:hypothetical protein